jgi:hypothetical protein
MKEKIKKTSVTKVPISQGQSSSSVPFNQYTEGGNDDVDDGDDDANVPDDVDDDEDNSSIPLHFVTSNNFVSSLPSHAYSPSLPTAPVVSDVSTVPVVTNVSTVPVVTKFQLTLEQVALQYKDLIGGADQYS